MPVREQVVAAILDDLVVVAVLALSVILLLHFLGEWYYVLPLLAVIGFLAFILVKGIAAQLRRPLTGLEAMVGVEGVVVEEAGEGYVVVKVDGELWKAECRGECRVGARVRVIGFRGLILIVEPFTGKEGRANR